MSFLSLMIFWIIMSGFLDLIHLSMGVATVAGVLYVNYQLKSHRFFDDDMNDLGELRFGRAVYYFFWMIVQIPCGYRYFTAEDAGTDSRTDLQRGSSQRPCQNDSRKLDYADTGNADCGYCR